MSQIRHSELFASQDWQVLYRAFSQINFNATDPASINKSLRDYIERNFPEDFNDWIESSEFVAIIDLLSWLAGTLAFKIDINARENFLETAQARESILRLARFLSYSPSRANPASGLVKLVEVSTDDNITDANGRSLSGQAIRWNNTDDPDWFENFTTVLNSAFISTNPFGTPLKSSNVSGVPTHLYRANSRMGQTDLRFTSRINSTSTDFEIVNVDYESNGTFFEREPNPDAAFHMLYRTDGNGNSSPNTGFFLFFKQGQLKTQKFVIDNPVENQLLNIDSSNIAENDVWVQTIDTNERVIKTWDRVPSVYSDNTTFNNLPLDQRDIYSIVSRDNDSISLRFSDGLFGNAPVGNVAATYRVVNGQRYSIQPLDISRVRKTISYINRRGVARTLTLVFSLVSEVSNATEKETDAQIKRRAPAVYSTQGRMVSGEDYNLFPLSSNLASKLKAVSRTYAGHSRHIDLNDPTSTYQDTNVFSDDGIIFEETRNYYEEVPISLNRSPSEIVTNHVQPMLTQITVKQHVLNEQINRALDVNNNFYVAPPIGTWEQSTSGQFSSTGRFTEDYALIQEGATFLFELPDATRKWVSIAEIRDVPNSVQFDQSRGPITLAEQIPSGSSIVAVIPSYNSDLSDAILNMIKEQVELDASFTLWFDPLSSTWSLENYTQISEDANPPSQYPASIKVASVEKVGQTLWRLTARGSGIVFESVRKVKWFADGAVVLDSETGAKRLDTVSVLGTNVSIDDDNGNSIRIPSVFNTTNTYYELNGKSEPRRINLTFTDNDEDGGFDQPNAYHRLISSKDYLNTLFWENQEVFGRPSFVPINNTYVYSDVSLLEDADKSAGKLAYNLSDDQFYIGDGVNWVKQNRLNYKVEKGRGPNVASVWVDSEAAYSPSAEPLQFQWKHFASTHHRIDPSRTNLIDMFVLSSEYDFRTRQWVSSGSNPDTVPSPPSELDLRLIFKNYEEFKMFTDEIVWRPVRYKLLFGNGTDNTNLKAKFKVVKVANTTVSDGEIKSRIIRAINQFFDVSRWDFGETFYFTELSAFVHQQLASIVASFVIVPLNEESSFGNLFEVSAQPDEIFLSTAQVSDITIISSNNQGNLRIS